MKVFHRVTQVSLEQSTKAKKIKTVKTKQAYDYVHMLNHILINSIKEVKLKLQYSWCKNEAAKLRTKKALLKKCVRCCHFDHDNLTTKTDMSGAQGLLM